jgi:hypothetical protein
MKKPQRYLIAKYVPDVRRMEPRNIGIVVWISGRAVAKFLPAQEAEFIIDKKTYGRWTSYWERLLSESSIAPLQGEPIPKDRPEFLDEFLKTQQGNYLLFDAGYIVDKVPATKIDIAANQLFDQLVDRKGIWSTDSGEQAARLKATCDRVFATAGLSRREDFKTPYRVRCAIGDIEKEFSFNYALGNGEPESAYHRVRLTAPQSVNSTAFMFEHVVGAKLLTKERCAAIVHAGNEIQPNSEADVSLQILSLYATVIDVANPDEAAEKLAKVAGI